MFICKNSASYIIKQLNSASRTMKRTAEEELEDHRMSKMYKRDDGQLVRHEQGDINNFIKDSGLKEALKRKGVKALFPIQYLTFKAIEEGKDIIARDKTGSGKTLAFSLPVLQRMRETREFEKSQYVKFMIILPTRELAIQVKDQIDSLRPRDGPDFRVIAVYGKDDMQRQIYSIGRGVDVIVGTPGRLIDLLQKGAIKTESMKVLCLDEADEMLKQGFKQDIEKIMGFIRAKAPHKIQNLLFSATIPRWLEDLSYQYLDQHRAYVNLVHKDEFLTPVTLKHYSMKLSYEEQKQKPELIMALMRKFAIHSGNTIIFVERKVDASNLSRKLDQAGVRNRALHGDVQQRQREQAFRSFKRGHLKVLVATNVCARGLDFPEIDLVVQAQPPKTPQPYIHRSGRTARKGNQGVSVTLYSFSQQRLLNNIQRQIKIEFTRLRTQDVLKANSRQERSRFDREENSGRYNTRMAEHKRQDEHFEAMVKNLSTRRSQSDILRFFEDKRLTCSGISLLKDSDGYSKGSAFLRFTSRKMFEDCLALNGCDYGGHHLNITPLKRE